jgi:hypothetical protein
MDKEQIRKALDHFENDEYTDAKEILQKEISDAKWDHLTNKLELDETCKPGHKKKKVDDEEDEDKKKEDEEDEDD